MREGRIKYFMLSWIGIILLFFPSNDSGFYYLTKINFYLKFIVYFWAIFVFFSKKIYKDKWYFPLWILLIWMIICTCVNDASSVRKCIITDLELFSVVVLSNYMIKTNQRKFMRYILRLMAIFMFINFISGVTGFIGTTYTDNTSVVNNYFIGQRVEIDIYIIYFIFVSFLCYFYNKKDKIWFLINGFSSIYFAISQWVATSIMGLVSFISVNLLHKKIKSKSIWKFIIIILSLAIIFFIYFQDVGIFNTFITKWLHKDLTLNGRLILWTQVFEQATGKHAIFGFGINPEPNLWWHTFVVNHPHNQFLQCIYNYGYPGLFIFILIQINLIKKISLIKNNSVRGLYVATIISSLIMCISARNFFYAPAMLFLAVSGNIDELEISLRK